MIRPLLAILLLVSSAWAAPPGTAPSIEICGNGYDDLNSGNTYGSCPAGWHNAVYQGTGCDRDCLAIDKDHDGYTTNGTGQGYDCDDTDRKYFPGQYRQGACSSGNYEKCQTNGSSTTCAALSAFTAKTGSGADFWISPAGVTTAGCGSFANPCNYLCAANTGLACYRAPVAGDAIIARGGNYSGGTWSTNKAFYISNIDGTLTNPILVIGAPGEEPVFQAAGTDPGAGTSSVTAEVITFHLDDSDYWNFQQITIDGNSAFSNSGIYLNGGNNSTVINSKIFGVRGYRNNNVSCIKASNGIGTVANHNLLYGCHDAAANSGGGWHNGSQENSRAIVAFDGQITANWNVAFHTDAKSSAVTGNCLTNKHGDPTYAAAFNSNILWNCNFHSIGLASINSVAKNNIIVDSDFAVQIADFGGGTPTFDNMQVLNNTYINTYGFQYIPQHSTVTIGLVTSSGNVAIDNRGSIHTNSGDDGDIRINNYDSGPRGAATAFADVITAQKLFFSDNCYYESGGQSPFVTIFGDASVGGAKYTSCATWFASSLLPAGHEANSVCTNPSLDYKHQSAVSGCGRGWAYNLYPSSGGASGTRRKGQLRYTGRKGQ